MFFERKEKRRGKRRERSDRNDENLFAQIRVFAKTSRRFQLFAHERPGIICGPAAAPSIVTKWNHPSLARKGAKGLVKERAAKEREAEEEERQGGRSEIEEEG